MTVTKKKNKRCYNCKELYPKNELLYTTDPYAEEIYGDNRLHWFCERCFDELAADI